MERLIDGIYNAKTTILAVIMFLVGVMPDIIRVLTDFSAIMMQLGEILSTGNWFALLSLKPALLAFIASVGLLFARDWKKSNDRT